MAEHINLYQRAVYYDVIFNRDVSREVDFLTQVSTRYTGGRLTSVLDLACGPGYHARAFARRGLRATGLDLRPEMLAFAQVQAAGEGVSVEWLLADMREFDLEEPVDLAFCMFDGIDALLTNQDLVRHFQAVAANLTPRGLYVVDLTHPSDCSYQDYGSFNYVGERDGISVELRWATNDPQFDLLTGVAYVEVEMRVNDHGQQMVLKDSANERMLLPQEIQLLAELSGQLEVVAWHGDFDLEQPLDFTPASRRMIAILQRRPV